MKKFLVGLFLVVTLSVLGANVNTERKLSTDREDKFLMLDEVSHVPDYEKFMSTYAKEKDDFRESSSLYNKTSEYAPVSLSPNSIAFK